MDISESSKKRIIELFGLGYTLTKIRDEVGAEAKQLSFDEFLQMVGIPPEKYTHQIRTNYCKSRNTRVFKDNKKKVLERDSKRCVVCGSNNHVHVHHVVPYSLTKNDDLENLLTLCYWHHSSAHGDRNNFYFNELCVMAEWKGDIRFSKKRYEEVMNILESRAISFDDNSLKRNAIKRCELLNIEYWSYLKNNNYQERMRDEWRKAGFSDPDIDDVIRERFG